MTKPRRAGVQGSGWFAAPNWLYEIPELSKHNQRDVLGHLMRRAGNDGSCFPSVKTMARCLGLSPRTVQRALRVLEEGGLVLVTDREDSFGRVIGRLYTPVKHDPRDRETPPGGVTESQGGGDSVTPPPVTESHPPGDSESPEGYPIKGTQGEVDPLKDDGRLLGVGGVVGGGAARSFRPEHDLEAWAIWRPRLAAAGVSPAKAAEEIGRGIEPELVLAWVLKAAAAGPRNPEAWLTACVRRGHWPREEWYHKQARTLLAPWREARIPGLTFAEILKSPPPEKPLGERKNEVRAALLGEDWKERRA